MIPLNQARLAGSRGEGTITAMGVIGLALTLAALAYHTVQYYNARTRLHSLGLQISNYAGSFMPNPKLACQRALEAFDAFRQDYRFAEGAKVQSADLRVAVRHYEYDLSNPNSEPVLKETTLATVPMDSLAVANRSCSPPAGSEIPPPYDSLIVQLRENYRPLQFTNIGDWSPIQVAVQFASRPTPTDVALVIDNSNSVVSAGPPFDSFVTNALHAGRRCDPALGDCSLYKYNSGDSGAGADATARVTANDILGRQCFGDVHKALKASAARLFDLLSSAASFRVGVVHQLSPGGEFPAPTININSDSYLKIYRRWKWEDAEIDEQGARRFGTDDFGLPLFRLGAPNEAAGWSGYESSRCALFVKEFDLENDGYDRNASPGHPLKAAFAAGSWHSSFFGYYSSSGLRGLLGESAQDGTIGNIDEFAFRADENFKIAARDLIWINSAGKQWLSGGLDPEYDFTSLQFGILRAFEMLNFAPRRKDDLNVRRKVVLVLTDGLERPGQAAPGGLGGGAPYAPGPDFYPLAPVPDAMDTRTFVHLAAISDSGEPLVERFGAGGAPIVSNFCQSLSSGGSGEQNEIYFESSVATGDAEADREANQYGIRLGVLLNGWRSGSATEPSEPPPPGDPFGPLYKMPGHDLSDTGRMDPFRSLCNTPWSRLRGRFLVESDNKYQRALYDEIAPRVARSLLDVEVAETALSSDGPVS